MEKQLLIIIGACLVLAGVVDLQLMSQKKSPAVAGLSTTNSPSPATTVFPTAEPSLIQIPTSTPTPTITSHPVATTTPTNSPTSDFSLEMFRYPNAKTITSSNNQLQLQSSDSPQAITNWYKDKLNSLGYSTTSFVTTNTNDNVENKLAAAGRGKNVQVEIKKSAGDSLVTIKVEVT